MYSPTLLQALMLFVAGTQAVAIALPYTNSTQKAESKPLHPSDTTPKNAAVNDIKAGGQTTPGLAEGGHKLSADKPEAENPSVNKPLGNQSSFDKQPSSDKNKQPSSDKLWPFQESSKSTTKDEKTGEK